MIGSAAVQRLLADVVAIADAERELVERRRRMLLALSREIQADAGVWSWGRGRPETGSVIPICVIDFGFDDRQRGVLTEWGLNGETDRTFRQPIRQQMGTSLSATTLWQDIFTPAEWEAQPYMRTQLAAGGWSSWLHSVRYSSQETWSNFFLLRNAGHGEFGKTEAMIVETVLAGVPWLHSTAEETLPPEAYQGLTPRQKMVLLMLLDGLPRKAIAYRLGITEDTVGDHVKSVYAHFAVGSSGELAALFLRGK